MNIKGQSFLTLKDYTPAQIGEFLDMADWLRTCKRNRVHVSGCEGDIWYSLRELIQVINDDLQECVAQMNGIILTEPEGPRYDPTFKEQFVKDLEEIVAKRTVQ